MANAVCRINFYNSTHNYLVCTGSHIRVSYCPYQALWSGTAKRSCPLLCLVDSRHTLIGTTIPYFYALPSAGITIDAFPAAVIGFTLNIGAYSSEVVRAALLSIPKQQWEAAYSISMTWWQALHRIIVPQAARVAVPPLSNTFISLVKDTSLASVITVPEMFLAAQRIAAVTYQPLILYSEAALIYLIFSSVLSTLQNVLENRLSGKSVKDISNDQAIQH